MLGPIDFTALAIVALIFIPLELIFPLHARKPWRKHWQNDLLFLVVNIIPITFGIVFFSVLLGEAAKIWMPPNWIAAVRGQPVWLQVLEILLLADIGFYLAHRTFHAVPFLWKFHAVHHSIEELDWLAGFRVHPIDQVLTKTVSYVPVILLGFSNEAFLAFALIYKWQSIAIHSNTRFRLGPLRWLIASPQFHHWHHANEPAAIDKNFAGQLPFLDLIGGTAHMPTEMPARYGTDTPVPQRYDLQLIHPFRRARVATGASDTP